MDGKIILIAALVIYVCFLIFSELKSLQSKKENRASNQKRLFDDWEIKDAIPVKYLKEQSINGKLRKPKPDVLFEGDFPAIKITSDHFPDLSLWILDDFVLYESNRTNQESNCYVIISPTQEDTADEGLSEEHKVLHNNLMNSLPNFEKVNNIRKLSQMNQDTLIIASIAEFINQNLEIIQNKINTNLKTA